MNAFEMFKRCAELQHPGRPSGLFYWYEQTLNLWPGAHIPHEGPGTVSSSKLLTLKWDEGLNALVVKRTNAPGCSPGALSS